MNRLSRPSSMPHEEIRAKESTEIVFTKKVYFRPGSGINMIRFCRFHLQLQNFSHSLITKNDTKNFVGKRFPFSKKIMIYYKKL